MGKNLKQYVGNIDAYNVNDLYELLNKITHKNSYLLLLFFLLFVHSLSLSHTHTHTHTQILIHMYTMYTYIKIMYVYTKAHIVCVFPGGVLKL